MRSMYLVAAIGGLAFGLAQSSRQKALAFFLTVLTILALGSACGGPRVEVEYRFSDSFEGRISCSTGYVTVSVADKYGLFDDTAELLVARPDASNHWRIAGLAPATTYWLRGVCPNYDGVTGFAMRTTSTQAQQPYTILATSPPYGIEQQWADLWGRGLQNVEEVHLIRADNGKRTGPLDIMIQTHAHIRFALPYDMGVSAKSGNVRFLVDAQPSNLVAKEAGVLFVRDRSYGGPDNPGERLVRIKIVNVVGWAACFDSNILAYTDAPGYHCNCGWSNALTTVVWPPIAADPFWDAWGVTEPLPWDKVQALVSEASNDLRTVCSTVWHGSNQLAGITVLPNLITVANSDLSAFEIADPSDDDMAQVAFRWDFARNADMCAHTFYWYNNPYIGRTWFEEYQAPDCTSWHPEDRSILTVVLVPQLTEWGRPSDKKVFVGDNFVVLADWALHDTPQNLKAPFCQELATDTTTSMVWPSVARQQHYWWGNQDRWASWAPNYLATAILAAAVPNARENVALTPGVLEPSNTLPRGYNLAPSYGTTDAACQEAYWAPFVGGL